MFKVMVCLLVGIPAISYAQDYGCATVGASMESSLFDAIKNDLNIDVATIIKDKTKCIQGLCRISGQDGL